MAIHTFYRGAHAFDAGTVAEIGEEARRFVATWLPGPRDLVEVFDLTPELAAEVHPRVVRKLATRPIEDLRIDFEDGYAGRTDDAEDADVERTAGAAAELAKRGELPGGFGIRVKATSPSLRERSLRTLDRFVETLLEGAGALPAGFAVNLAKVEEPGQVTILVEALARLESRLALAPGSIAVELMAETPRAVFAPDGRVAVPSLIAAAGGRCRSIEFGIYDFTASCGVAAGYQGLRHPLCDVARSVIHFALAGTGVGFSDGSSQVVPEAPPGHPDPRSEVRRRARSVYDDVRHSLERAIYRGWDLHPAHAAIRFVAVTAFYREQLPAMSARMRRAVEAAGAPGFAGGALEDAATRQALVGFFERGRGCGALDAEELTFVGLSPAGG